MKQREQQTKTTPGLHIPDGLPDTLLPIAEEAHRVHESALWSGQGQFEQTKIWRSMNALLGVPAASLAAIAGGTGLANSHRVGYAAVLALISAALSAALTTLNPSRRTTQSQSAANAYMELQTATRQFVTIDLATMTPDGARQRLEELTISRNEINNTADPPGRRARKRAREVIAGGGQTYEIDELKASS